MHPDENTADIYDINDTDSVSRAPAGAGLSLPLKSVCATDDLKSVCVTDEVVKLAAGPAALHQHLVREFASAEQVAARNSGPAAVSSVMCVDLGQVERQYHKWTEMMPRVRPYYAVKANPDAAIVRTLLDLGAGFDCASASEIQMVLAAGGDSLRDMIFANCCKFPSDIAYAERQGLKRMTFDNTDELHKIAQIFPQAQVVLRIVTDDSGSVCRLSNKYGASMNDVEDLITTAIELNLDLVGVSFHVGSGTSNPQSFSQPIENAALVFEQARSQGIEMNLLDIGGGFPGDDDGVVSFGEIAHVINPLLASYFPSDSVEVIAEPGRFFSHASASLACKVMSRRVVSEKSRSPEDPQVLYYIGDGVYGSFNCILFDHYTPPKPVPIFANSSDDPRETTSCRLFGPTCDGLDTIFEMIELPSLNIGDMLVFKHMGAYTVAAASNFNGIQKPSIVYVRT